MEVQVWRLQLLSLLAASSPATVAPLSCDRSPAAAATLKEYSACIKALGPLCI